LPKYKVEWQELLDRSEVVEADTPEHAIERALLIQPRLSDVMFNDLLSEEAIEVEEVANDD